MKKFIAVMLVTGASLIPKADAANLTWYDDALRPGLQDWSWTTHDVASTAFAHGGTRAIRMEPDFWGGVYFVDPTQKYRFDAYRALTFWVHGGGSANQQLTVQLTYNGLTVASAAVNSIIAGGGVASNAWRQATWNFDAATTLTHGAFDGVIVMDATGNNQAPVYLDDLVFLERTTPLATTPMTATIDFAGARRAINPEIYGVNFGSDAQHADLRYPLRRWGGNSTTRFNWKSDSHNTAFDYFYQNIADGTGSGLPANNGANRFIDANRAHGAQTIMTVTTIGWRPIGDRVKRWGFSITKYGPQDQNECSIYNPPPDWCAADAGNGTCANVANTTGHCVNGLIVNNQPGDTSEAITPAWTTEWLDHLVGRYGTAAAGGVGYYALDNEAMLWNSTHRDVHPQPPTYDEVWTSGRDHALAIKAVDASARVMGPVTWGWCDLFTSAADAAVGPSCLTGADRDAHGGLPFAEWYAKQVCDYASAHGGLRPVDYFDAHFYPQGDVSGLGGASDSEAPADSARRLRSLRELYDPTYVSESWVGADGSKPNLIPRLKAWLASRCAPMKLALTEYKWGPDDGPSGALAQAEALAIFGREGLDLATRWVAPEDGTLAEDAFRMFLDYDGTHTRVVGDSVATTSSSGELGAYTVEDAAGGRTYVLLFNRATAPAAITVNLGATLSGPVRVFRFDAGLRWTQVATDAITGTTYALANVPGRSASLVVLPARAATPGDTVFASGFE